MACSADGEDVALIDFEVVDASGERCPTDDARVDFTWNSVGRTVSATGPAIWRGGYNSGKTNSTNNLYLNTECGINRVAMRSTLMPGTITADGHARRLAARDDHVRLQTGCDQGRSDAGNAANPVAGGAGVAVNRE